MNSKLTERQAIGEQIDDFRTKVEERVLDNYIEDLAWAENEAERGPIRLAIRRETNNALKSLANF